jgi:hypothetical protein
MKNFQHITTFETEPLLVALRESHDLWNQFPIRTTHPNSPHTQVDDILIRFNELTSDPRDAIDDKECYWFPAASQLPVANYIYTLLATVFGDQIGRCVITKMAPGTKITKHEDHGSPANYYQRFHIAIQQEPGAVFHCQDESYTPKQGDVFIFNNSLEHSVENNSTVDRITMIVDIRTPYFEHIKQTYNTAKTTIEFSEPKIHGNYMYSQESFEEIIPELKDFEHTHWLELAVSKDSVPVDMDWQRFVKMEREGKLHTVTVRKNHKLVGYHITLVGGHLHYKSTLHGIVDLYYIKKDDRLGRTGLRLFQYAEMSLKQRGVKKIITGTKLHSDNTRLLEFLGYKNSDKTFFKVLA